MTIMNHREYIAHRLRNSAQFIEDVIKHPEVDEELRRKVLRRVARRLEDDRISLFVLWFEINLRAGTL